MHAFGVRFIARRAASCDQRERFMRPKGALHATEGTASSPEGRLHATEGSASCDQRERFMRPKGAHCFARLIALNSAWMEAAMMSSLTPAPQLVFPSGRVTPT